MSELAEIIITIVFSCFGFYLGGVLFRKRSGPASWYWIFPRQGDRSRLTHSAPPNRFERFICRVFLGWKYQQVSPDPAAARQNDDLVRFYGSLHQQRGEDDERSRESDSQ